MAERDRGQRTTSQTELASCMHRTRPFLAVFFFAHPALFGLLLFLSPFLFLSLSYFFPFFPLFFFSRSEAERRADAATICQTPALRRQLQELLTRIFGDDFSQPWRHDSMAAYPSASRGQHISSTLPPSLAHHFHIQQWRVPLGPRLAQCSSAARTRRKRPF